MVRALADRPRAAGAVFMGAFVLVAATAWSLDPDPRGFGTHEQLGLPPCAMYSLTGVPCPFCGMTTAFAYASRGRILKAFLTHPGGTMLFLMGVCGVFGMFVGDRWQGAFCSKFGRWSVGRWLVAALSVLAASWLYVAGKTLLAH